MSRRTRDYTIYAQNGEVFKHVRNARDPNDDTPTLVTLPAGSYKVEAEALRLRLRPGEGADARRD